ncbi:hypothetical protein H4R18_005940 [Coemansia javaensis]|uniref:RNase H type-1 domain-containing protein n=1 Tax=Coemansia javaensis TaxID=2761396 RepID=A0A9W8H084_9FUNG|nr:hypothetical protein H4R18_005940 [Coemansia javaensis]
MIKIYVDGSYIPATGAAGIGVYFADGSERTHSERLATAGHGGFFDQNQAEAAAVAKALALLGNHQSASPTEPAQIMTDSHYVINGIASAQRCCPSSCGSSSGSNSTFRSIVGLLRTSARKISIVQLPSGPKPAEHGIADRLAREAATGK